MLHVTRVILLAAVLVSACGIAPEPAPSQQTSASGQTSAPDARACSADSVCGAGEFCDRGRCVAVYEPHRYGWPCDPSTEPTEADLAADPLLGGKINSCGAYVCRDLRCRSCSSDADCPGDRARCYDGATADPPLRGWRCGVPPTE